MNFSVYLGPRLAFSGDGKTSVPISIMKRLLFMQHSFFPFFTLLTKLKNHYHELHKYNKNTKVSVKVLAKQKVSIASV